MNAQTKKQTAQTEQPSGNGSDTSKPQVLPDVSNVNIRPLGKDEKPTVKAVVQGEDWKTSRVEYHFEVGGTKAINKPHQVVSILDFSECSREEILALACKPVVIALQRRWNTLAADDMSKATAPGTFHHVNVKRDIVDSQRQSAPPSAKASKLVDKLSPTEKAELMRKLQEELNAA